VRPETRVPHSSARVGTRISGVTVADLSRDRMLTVTVIDYCLRGAIVRAGGR
jgi:hypothetical protein